MHVRVDLQHVRLDHLAIRQRYPTVQLGSGFFKSALKAIGNADIAESLQCPFVDAAAAVVVVVVAVVVIVLILVLVQVLLANLQLAWWPLSQLLPLLNCPVMLKVGILFHG